MTIKPRPVPGDKALGDASAAERQPDANPMETLPVVPGYEFLKFLGAGAYGRVWVARDTTTGRRVAIKFFSKRSAWDGSLLSCEVEKLVFLSADRFVVQLLDVGWDAEPPFYVMEYIENGSLDDRLRREGPLGISEAVTLFRELAVGVSHAHSRGVLHCDLKPANVLLDTELHPRLADFGQSRLTGEQRPALGTLFYMAPEQADLKAIPDAQWDVYALGALFHCMVTGEPPYRSADAVRQIETKSALEDRLAAYQHVIQSTDRPNTFRKLPGMDRALADIIGNCLAADPADRLPHVANLIESLDRRQRSLSRRPLVLLGLLGPLLLFITMALFGFRAYESAVDDAQRLARQGVQNSNRFAAEGQAQIVALEIEQRFRSVTNAADSRKLVRLMAELQDQQPGKSQLARLADPTLTDEQRQATLHAFLQNPARQALQHYAEERIDDPQQPDAASWIITAQNGVMIAASFRPPAVSSPVGTCFAFRAYFHGGPQDFAPTRRDALPLDQTQISTVFRSTATGTAKVAMTTPVRQGTKKIGVVGVTVELGDFVRFATSDSQCALLVDGREGDNHGVVLEHPLFETFAGTEIPEDFFSTYRVSTDKVSATGPYHDPFAKDRRGAAYRGDWIAASAPVKIQDVPRDNAVRAALKPETTINTGLVMIVQSRAESATEPVKQLAHRIHREGVAAAIAVLAVTCGLWYFVVHTMQSPQRRPHRQTALPIPDDASVHSRETLEQP